MTPVLTIITIFVLFRILTMPLRRRREKKMWNKWNSVQKFMDENSNLLFGKVWSIRQSARTGTKAYMQWYKGSACQALWVNGVWLKTGEYIIVEGNEGHGRHHEEAVLYVQHLYERLPRDIENCWRKYNKRLEKIEIKDLQKTITE